MMQSSASKKLAQQAVPRLILQLSLPAILGMLVSSLYNLSDTFFAARLGPLSLIHISEPTRPY